MEKEEVVVEEKEEDFVTESRGRGEDGDGPHVGGVERSGGRLFFYLSLTVRRERTHTGSTV